MIVDTLTADDAAVILHKVFGSLRNWHDFLADCIRERTTFLGLTLMPGITIKLPGDRCKRPRYASAQVREFIVTARDLMPSSSTLREFCLIKIEIDPSTALLPWKMRTGKPVAPSSAGVET